MHKPIKYFEKALTMVANGAWFVYDRANRIAPNPSFTPKWSEKPLLKSYQKQKPPLGWPRATDSLCPKCVPEIRQQSAPDIVDAGHRRLASQRRDRCRLGRRDEAVLREIRPVHDEHGGRTGGEGVGVVAKVGAVGRTDLAEACTAVGEDLGDAE